jgi:hypothetical protein
MFSTGRRPTALGLFMALLLVFGTALASFGQQPATPPGGASAGGRPATPPPPPAEPLASLFGEEAGLPPIDRLAGTPNMFGDLFPGGSQLSFAAPTAFVSGTFDLPLAGATRRLKVGENNGALTQDRINFVYNHYHNALNEEASAFVGDPTQRALSVDRYTLGVEKTLGEGCWSVELRMPLAGETNFATSQVGISGGAVGDLAVILKRIVYMSDCTVVSAGLGIATPTGSDVRGRVFGTAFTMQNQAVYLTPYVALLRTPTDRFFYQGFLEVDVPTNGNRIDYVDTVNGSGTFGTLRDQTLLYADLSAGYWLYRNRYAPGLSGLASLVEVHYTTAMENADSVSGFGNGTASRFSFGNLAGRADVVNLTVGLHAEFAEDTLLRVGGVFPLGTGVNRAFDSEVQVQVERRF